MFRSKGATVYTFEPNPIAFAELEKKFKDDDKVFLYEKAVSVKNEILKLYMYQYNKEDQIFWSVGASTYQTKDDVDTKDYIEVESIDLLEFIEELNTPIDILKIDIEGGEYDILLKLIEKELYKKIKIILVETHDRHIPEIIPRGNKVRKLIERKKISNINLDWL